MTVTGMATSSNGKKKSKKKAPAKAAKTKKTDGQKKKVSAKDAAKAGKARAAAHDAAAGRNPRKWRDLNVEAWKRKAGIKLREKVAAYPWQKKPCALQARIDPNLTIEAYYRGQEARGIQATPQAEDFTFSRC